MQVCIFAIPHSRLHEYFYLYNISFTISFGSVQIYMQSVLNSKPSIGETEKTILDFRFKHYVSALQSVPDENDVCRFEGEYSCLV